MYISSPNTFEKFNDIGVKNVTSLNWFARIRFAEYHHSCGHNSKDNLKEYINKDILTRFLQHVSLLCVNANTLP